MRMAYKFIGTTDGHQITRQTDSSFIHLFQRAVLLGLKEAGFINEMQHRQAEAALIQQYREDIRTHSEFSQR